jgi:hypothetical protein
MSNLGFEYTWEEPNSDLVYDLTVVTTHESTIFKTQEPQMESVTATDRWQHDVSCQLEITDLTLHSLVDGAEDSNEALGTFTYSFGGRGLNFCGVVSASYEVIMDKDFSYKFKFD